MALKKQKIEGKPNSKLSDLRRSGVLLEVGCDCGHVQKMNARNIHIHGNYSVTAVYRRVACRECGRGMSYSRAAE
jgi:hypothetical protein